MAIIATKENVLSDVLMQDSFNVVENFNYAKVTLEQASDTTVSVGHVVIWDTTLVAYRLLVNGDFTSDTAITIPVGGTVPNGAGLAVVVGFDSLGDKASATVGTAGAKGVALYRGIASVKKSGLKFAAGVVAARQTLTYQLLEKQDIAVKNTLQAVSSSFYGA
jgi:hypothetical protein